MFRIFVGALPTRILLPSPGSESALVKSERLVPATARDVLGYYYREGCIVVGPGNNYLVRLAERDLGQALPTEDPDDVPAGEVRHMGALLASASDTPGQLDWTLIYWVRDARDTFFVRTVDSL